MGRILLVDDDPTVLSLEQLLLAEHNHEVLTVSDARSAIDMMRLYSLDLAIIDVFLPDMDGFRLVSTIRSDIRLRELPIAFLTAKNGIKDVQQAIELKADFYITKPIVREDFLEKISAFFAKNAAKTFPSINFSDFCSGEAKICHSVQITSISDFGMEVLIDQKIHLENDAVMELSSPVLQEIPLRSPLLRVVSIKNANPPLKRVRLRFMDENTEDIRRIQKWIAYTKLKQEDSTEENS